MSRMNLVPLLRFINPDEDYGVWLNVGMALKHEGYPLSAWEDWSRKGAKFHEGECEKKWNSFNENTSEIVTGATITQLAKERGWKSEDYDEPIPFDYRLTDEDLKIVEPDYVSDELIVEPTNDEWNQVDDAINYLNALFKKDDRVNFVVDTYQDSDGRWKPKGYGSSAFTAGELIARLKKYRDIYKAVGHPMRKGENGNEFPTDEAGAWIRFNPVSDGGSNDASIAEYRYALVESDTLPIGKQLSLIKKLNLPIAALVASGGKSIHAIVKVFADTEREYRDKVDRLYKICQKNGLDVDYKNKNPSRLSRFPGYYRGERKQYLIATDIGAKSYEEWLDWVQDMADDLPAFSDFDEVSKDLPALAPPLINGVLRQGHKLLISGPSKAGKSFLLIELALAVKEGAKWIDFDCAEGNVLYVNLEIDPASFFHRVADVYEKLDIPHTDRNHLYIWNLRGDSIPMDKLAPIIIRRAKDEKLKLVIIDPIYKVITGDENSAGDMAKFCNNFDRICKNLGVSVAYVHHHSKGSKGNVNVMDRASGSGVFARDPDALLDIEPLETAFDASEADPPFRVQGVLREFPSIKPINMWFRWPIHTVDHDGILKDYHEQGSAELGLAKGHKTQSEKKMTAVEALRKLMEGMVTEKSEGVTKKVILARYEEDCGKSISPNTFTAYLKQINESEKENGFVFGFNSYKNSYQKVPYDPELGDPQKG